MFKNAFTLVEILITLMVIGIVASIVIPGIINNTNEAEMKISFKKNYASLVQAIELIKQDNSNSLVGVFNNNFDMANKLTTVMNVSKICYGTSIAGNCFPDKVLKLNGTNENWYSNPVAAALILSNGSSLYIQNVTKNCTGANLTFSNNCSEVDIDINGLKKPNTLGKDIFSVYVYTNTIKPMGIQGDGIYEYYPKCISGNTDNDNYGYSCAAKVLQE